MILKIKDAIHLLILLILLIFLLVTDPTILWAEESAYYFYQLQENENLSSVIHREFKKYHSESPKLYGRKGLLRRILILNPKLKDHPDHIISGQRIKMISFSSNQNQEILIPSTSPALTIKELPPLSTTEVPQTSYLLLAFAYGVNTYYLNQQSDLLGNTEGMGNNLNALEFRGEAHTPLFILKGQYHQAPFAVTDSNNHKFSSSLEDLSLKISPFLLPLGMGLNASSRPIFDLRNPSFIKIYHASTYFVDIFSSYILASNNSITSIDLQLGYPLFASTDNIALSISKIWGFEVSTTFSYAKCFIACDYNSDHLKSYLELKTNISYQWLKYKLGPAAGPAVSSSYQDLVSEFLAGIILKY